MEKHGDYAYPSLADVEVGLESADADIVHTFSDWSCVAGIWSCSFALSSFQLGLQTRPSQNHILQRWQNIVESPVRKSSQAVVLVSIAFCALGYSTCCMYAYRRSPARVAITATICVGLILLETLWNGLYISPFERLMVALPLAVNAGLTWALYQLKCTTETATLSAKTVV